MGQIRKIGDQYYIEFYARGLMYSQIAGLSEEGARKMLEAVESKIAGGEALTIVREINLEVFFQGFLDDSQKKFSPISLKRFSLSWQHWLNFLNKNYPNIHNVSQITPFLVESYKFHLAELAKPKVVNLTILLLREIFEYAIRIGFLNDNPTLHVVFLKMPHSPLRKGRRSELAKELLAKGVTLGKIYSLLKLTDVAQIMFWSNSLPLRRVEVHA